MPRPEPYRSTRRSRGEIEAIVLSCLKQAAAPLGAYEVSGAAAAAGSHLAAMQVYRTLGRLVEHGTVHRVETLSAYLAIDRPIDGLAICRMCRNIEALAAPDLKRGLLEALSSAQFRAHRTVIEIIGLCARCQQRADAGLIGRGGPPPI